jgi:hypothetical protein
VRPSRLGRLLIVYGEVEEAWVLSGRLLALYLDGIVAALARTDGGKPQQKDG